MMVEQVKIALASVIDLETGADVLSMGMVHDIQIIDGIANLTFEPTSPVCPLVFKLCNDIVEGVKVIPEIQHVRFHVINHRQSQAIEELFNSQIPE